MASAINTMILVKPAAGKEQAVLEGLKKYAATVEAEDPACLSWHIIDIHEANEQDGGKDYAVLERYADQAAYDAHFNSANFAEMKGLAPLLREPVKTRKSSPIGGFIMRK